MTDRLRLPAVDGLRGLAVILVLIHHAGSLESYVSPLVSRAHWGSMGWFGVDIFFALSGFLITRILIANRERGVGLGQFYARRAARLLPAAAACAILIGCVYSWAESAWAMSYVYNWRLPPAKSPAGHFWSLAVEEQWYVVWPLAVALLPSRWLRPATLMLIVAMVTANVLTAAAIPLGWVTESTGRLWLAAATPTRGLPIAMGAMLAIGQDRLVGQRSGLWLGLALLGGGWLLHGWAKPAMVGHAETALRNVVAALSATGLLAVVLSGQWSAMQAVFCDGWLRWVGRVSYGLYLYHYPIFWLTGADTASRPHHLVVPLAATVAVAAASYYGFERPILDGSWRRLIAWRRTCAACPA